MTVTPHPGPCDSPNLAPLHSTRSAVRRREAPRYRVEWDGDRWRIAQRYVNKRGGSHAVIYERLLWLGWGTEQAARRYVELHGIPGAVPVS